MGIGHIKTLRFCITLTLSQLVEFVRSIFVVKDYQAKKLQLLIRIEQNRLGISDYIRKFNDFYSFWKSEVSEKFVIIFLCWACVVVLYELT